MYSCRIHEDSACMKGERHVWGVPASLRGSSAIVDVSRGHAASAGGHIQPVCLPSPPHWQLCSITCLKMLGIWHRSMTQLRLHAWIGLGGMEQYSQVHTLTRCAPAHLA
jgi:hypothetical protein